MLTCACVVQHIQFDSFKVWEGRCAPEAQAGGSMMGVVKPEWKGQRATPAPATLETEMTLATGFVGGGCPDIKIKNTSGRVCSDWEMDLHIRPTFGNVHATKQGSVKPMQPSGFTVLEHDTEAGAPRTYPCVVGMTMSWNINEVHGASMHRKSRCRPKFI